MILYSNNVDLICCKTVKSEKYGERTYGKLYEDGRLTDFVSNVPLKDMRNVNATFDFRYGVKDGKLWTMLTLVEWEEN